MRARHSCIEAPVDVDSSDSGERNYFGILRKGRSFVSHFRLKICREIFENILTAKYTNMNIKDKYNVLVNIKILRVLILPSY